MWLRTHFGCIVIILAVLLSALNAQAQTTIRVPTDLPTIQQAINATVDGDTVLVAPGTYVENINFLGKAITVTSEGGPEVTIIDGNQAGSVVTFSSGEGQASVLRGFTLQNGFASFGDPSFGSGGGIRIENSSPTVEKNIVSNNQACAGAGIAIGFGSPIIQGNTITKNNQGGCSGGIGGGGISIGGNSSAQILDNVISENFMGSSDGGGISLFAAGTPTIKGNVISGNTATGLSPCAEGGGIWIVNFSDALIVQNLITGNTAGCGGGIFWLVPFGALGPLLVNNTIADNDSPQGSGIFADGFDAQTELINNIVVAKAGQTAVYCGDFNDLNPPIFTFNDVFSPSGTAYGGICTDQTGINGNISNDPLFLDPANGNYHVQSGSPVIDVGDNTAQGLPDKDIDGDPRITDGNGDGVAAVDMGVDETISIGPTLTVTKTGTGTGTVTSSPIGIDCGSTCSASFTAGTPVTLTATPDPGSTFAGWSGDADCADGNVTMDADTACTATFNLTNGPDLTGTWNSLTQTCRGVGATQKCQLKGSVQVRNQGNQKAPLAAFLWFYLSADNVFDGGDTFLKQVAVGALNPGKAQGKKLSYMLPTGQTASGQYVIAVIDATNTVLETDESNNVIVFGPLP